MNLTTACSRQDNSCQISCQDPSSSNACVQLQADLVDGSSCGFGGTCKAGVCEAGNLIDTAKAWYLQNLQIAIPVTVVVGIIVLLLLWGLFMSIRRCCRRRKMQSTEPALSGQQGRRIPSWLPGSVPPPLMTQGTLMSPPPVMTSARPMASVTPLLRTGTSKSRAPSAFPVSIPPSPSRNQSWDGSYRGPASGEAAPSFAPTHKSSASTGSLARNRLSGIPTQWNAYGGLPSRPASNTRSHWVDPSRWNGES